MQKAQFLSRDKTLYRCKLLFNGSTPNLACDTATLKQYISVFKIYFSFSKIVSKTDRQTDRQRNRDRDRERINFQIKKKKIQSSSPSLSLQIYLGHKKEYKVYTGRRIKHI